VLVVRAQPGPHAHLSRARSRKRRGGNCELHFASFERGRRKEELRETEAGRFVFKKNTLQNRERGKRSSTINHFFFTSRKKGGKAISAKSRAFAGRFLTLSTHAPRRGKKKKRGEKKGKEGVSSMHCGFMTGGEKKNKEESKTQSRPAKHGSAMETKSRGRKKRGRSSLKFPSASWPGRRRKRARPTQSRAMFLECIVRSPFAAGGKKKRGKKEGEFLLMLFVAEKSRGEKKRPACAMVKAAPPPNRP